jgi:hypothetical protein
MEVKTLRPKALKEVKEFFNKLTPEIKALINNSEWVPLYDNLKSGLTGHGWAFNGCFWSIIYSIEDTLYNDLGIVPEGAFAYTDVKEIDLENVISIKTNAFYNSNISDIKLSNKLKNIGDRAFLTDKNSIIHIRFDGTMKEFKNIKKGNDWYKSKYDNNNRIVYVVCNDGDLEYGG